MRRRPELLGLPGSERGRHVQSLHDLIVAEALVVLELGDKAVGKGHDGFYPVPDLAVTEVLKEQAHLRRQVQTPSLISEALNS